MRKYINGVPAIAENGKWVEDVSYKEQESHVFHVTCSYSMPPRYKLRLFANGKCRLYHRYTLMGHHHYKWWGIFSTLEDAYKYLGRFYA